MNKLQKIIFIDDNFANIKETYYLACKMIFTNKYEVVNYLQPEYANEFLKISSFEVAIIILDIMFVGDGIYKGGYTRGIDVYIEYKEKYSNIPIIILTQLEKDKDIDEEIISTVTNNNDKFLEKIDTTPQQLVNCIKELLAKKISK